MKLVLVCLLIVTPNILLPKQQDNFIFKLVKKDQLNTTQLAKYDELAPKLKNVQVAKLQSYNPTKSLAIPLSEDVTMHITGYEYINKGAGGDKQILWKADYQILIYSKPNVVDILYNVKTNYVFGSIFYNGKEYIIHSIGDGYVIIGEEEEK